MKSMIPLLLIGAVLVAAVIAIGPKNILLAVAEKVNNFHQAHFCYYIQPASKQVIVFAPTSTTNGATTSGNIDTLGFDFVSVDIVAPTADVVSNKFQTCKLSHSETTDATNFSDLTKFVAGGVGGFTLANANTSNPYGVKLNVDCRTLKRYLKLSVSPRTTQVLCAVANLHKGDSIPIDAAGAGVNTLVEG